MRLGDLDELNQRIIAEEHEIKTDNAHAVGLRNGLTLAQAMVINTPTVDAVPVVHGEWFSLTECANAGVYCSVCHKKVYKEDYAWSNKRIKMRSNYCPNCGASMKDGE